MLSTTGNLRHYQKHSGLLLSYISAQEELLEEDLTEKPDEKASQTQIVLAAEEPWVSEGPREIVSSGALEVRHPGSRLWKLSAKIPPSGHSVTCGREDTQ